jgi:hypothetical protein
MVRITYNGFNKSLRLAVNNVNNLLQQEYFYLGIQKHEAFDLSDISPAQLGNLMRIADIQMSVDLYYSLFPFSNTLIADNQEEPYVIRINKWNLGCKLESLGGALMHQCVHAVNAYFPQFSFGHGDDMSSANENTAPYWIASLAEKYIAADNIIYEAMADEEVSGLPFLQQFTAPAKKRPAYIPVR